MKADDRIKDGDDYEVKIFLEEQAEEVIGNWLIFRSHSHYGGGRICELMLALRNKEAHYEEMNGKGMQREFLGLCQMVLLPSG